MGIPHISLKCMKVAVITMSHTSRRLSLPTRNQTHTKKRVATVAMSFLCALGLTFSLAACGAQNAQKTSSASLPQIQGLKMTGELGKEPNVTFKTPLKVPNQGYAILEKGNGAPFQDNDKLCSYAKIIDAKTGKVIQDSWTTKDIDCSVYLNKADGNKLYPILKKMRTNGVLALSSTDKQSDRSYIMVISLLKRIHILSKAEGTPVKDIPGDLPKVTLDKDGVPSITMNNYKAPQSLVSQTLIQGSGDTVHPTDTVTVHYTGWLLNGKQFDSSWTRKQPFDAPLAGGVIQGWTQGLSNKKVGSQVLLVIPPQLGYGDKAQGNIPANSTLVFVVDILGTEHKPAK